MKEEIDSITHRRTFFKQCMTLSTLVIPVSSWAGMSAQPLQQKSQGLETLSLQKVPLFQQGQKVRVSLRFPLGHYRTPVYIRGKEGTIERVLSEFLNPEEEGYGRNAGKLIRLYRVRFFQKEIWPNYQGSALDHLEIEIYEHWLEPV
jgi:nitrile hydratase